MTNQRRKEEGGNDLQTEINFRQKRVEGEKMPDKGNGKQKLDWVETDLQTNLDCDDIEH